MSVTISRTELARNTREIVERVRRGNHLTVESYGEEQIVLLDVLDYHLLRAVARFAAPSGIAAEQDPVETVIHAYLAEHISVSKAAEQLGLSRFDLLARFERLGIPLRQGAASLEDARDEAEAARAQPPLELANDD